MLTQTVWVVLGLASGSRLTGGSLSGGRPERGCTALAKPPRRSLHLGYSRTPEGGVEVEEEE